MGTIESFLARYRKEYDFYDQAARLVAQIVESNLQAAGIRCMVTSRAKSVNRLEAKVRERSQKKTFETVDAIFGDIVDLAGVRIALYFPGERNRIEALLQELLLIDEAKTFPTDGPSKYAKRFSGYWATHYRVRLRDSDIPDSQKRYAEARVEVQVASVLMHAWAEVEHDLVYKPLQGELSVDEYAVLDELNGLVLAGELALERLQRAGESRVAARDRVFRNHFDLAAHLLAEAGNVLNAPPLPPSLGRVDLLFDFLQRLNLLKPEQLAPYIAALHGDLEQRPLSEQIVDQLLKEDSTRYRTFDEVRQIRPSSDDLSFATSGTVIDPVVHQAFGNFMQAWIEFEKALNTRVASEWLQSSVPTSTAQLIRKYPGFSAELRAEVSTIQRLRNELVHGKRPLNIEDLNSAAERLRNLTPQLL
jgi:ppGpp synthetase/RelA/SpoT-type nucleotidyltranferase